MTPVAQNPKTKTTMNMTDSEIMQELETEGAAWGREAAEALRRQPWLNDRVMLPGATARYVELEIEAERRGLLAPWEERR